MRIIGIAQSTDAIIRMAFEPKRDIRALAKMKLQDPIF